MPKYLFNGQSGRILFGLTEGGNAHTTRANADDVLEAPGSTVVLSHGDSLVTDEPYTHPELQLIEDGTQAPAAAPAPVTPAPAPEPAPAPAPADPAPVTAPTF
jgi:hypothetical protein